MACERTQQELATAVLRSLGLLDALHDPDAQDKAYIIARYEDIMAELRFEEVGYWENNAIPLEIFEPLVELVGLTVSGAFGMSAMAENIEGARRVLKGRLRRHTSKPVTGLAIRAEYF